MSKKFEKKEKSTSKQPIKKETKETKEQKKSGPKRSYLDEEDLDREDDY